MAMLRYIIFNYNHYRAIIPHKSLSTPLFPFQFSHNFTTSESDSFTVSYLINTIGFPRETALKASKRLRFNSPQKPNSVFTFFTNLGFSDSNIRTIIIKAPWLLSSQPHNSILPKFQFFLSKGASSSDIIPLLTSNPQILQYSLDKRIIPLFELLSRFLKSSKDTIVCLIRHSRSFTFYPHHLLEANINLMTDFGVSDNVIASTLQSRPSIFGSKDLIKSLEEVKCLGFDPSTASFGAALAAKKCLSKKLWDEKVDVFKKWGWSDEAVIRAFRGRPELLLTSIDKINLVMSFWVNQLGWNSLALSKRPRIFSYSLHKRIVPRALVLQYLVMKGLRKKNASLVEPFAPSKEMFLRKYVLSFKEDSDYLLKLYEENVNLASTKENIDMPFTK